MLKFSGNPRQLKKLEAKLRAAGDTMGIISAQLAEEALNQSRETFKKQADPYGCKWAGRKRTTRRNSGKAIGVASGLMRNSVHTVIGAAQFTIAYARPYAQWFHGGTRKMVARMLVPTEGKGLPSKWAREFKLVAEDVLTELFG